MKLIKYFDAFLENTVNLNQARMDLLDTRTTAITNFLKTDEVFGPILKASIPQGSFAQKTIIRPRANGTFDADVLLHLDPAPDWAACEYVGKLYTALGRSPVYKEMRHRRTRCVYIDYSDEFHVDLVPYIETYSGGYITNRKTDKFELSDPKGFTGWLKDQHRIADYHLVKVIRLLKHVRDITWGFNVKSVILTTLVGERVSQLRSTLAPGCYADVPTTLKTVIDDLDDYLQQNYFLPAIVDPGGTQDRLDDRWDQQGYAVFRAKINELRTKIDEAFEAEDIDASVKAWQAIFGDAFKAPATTAAAGRGALVVFGGKTLPVTERFLDKDFGFPFIERYSVKMIGRVRAKGPMTSYQLPDQANQVDKGRELDFKIDSTNAPEPFDVYWKVRNTGNAAQQAGALRGEIKKGGRTHFEQTLYAGRHFVECYIVTDGACVAHARQPVVIT